MDLLVFCELTIKSQFWNHFCRKCIKFTENSQKISRKLLIFIKIEEKNAIFTDFWLYFYQKVLFLLKMHKNTLKKREKSEK